ncbi:hypothetical protein J5N97_024726 [Dioscorea zingiberensis]|uniref:Uncharacterized protein n=1 Tax=Dioscorea zingiberensis TaxID=325984 RepID=A0A9D5C7H3_9LILI|nr:hypothetical protein J5N97_024726 [Dioscorea zingiberensis]
MDLKLKRVSLCSSPSTLLPAPSLPTGVHHRRRSYHPRLRLGHVLPHRPPSADEWWCLTRRSLEDEANRRSHGRIRSSLNNARPGVRD